MHLKLIQKPQQVHSGGLRCDDILKCWNDGNMQVGIEQEDNYSLLSFETACKI